MKKNKKTVYLKRERNMCGKQIRILRLCAVWGVRKMSQTELAERITKQGYPISRITVSRIENGVRAVSDIEILQFANALNVDVHRLLCGTKTVKEAVSVLFDSVNAA